MCYSLVQWIHSCAQMEKCVDRMYVCVVTHLARPQIISYVFNFYILFYDYTCSTITITFCLYIHVFNYSLQVY